jgi:outer membrane protein assembly factor BamD (BamD/ComL family)
MSVKEQVVEEIKMLSEAELEEVARYLAFLKFRARQATPTFDETQLAALYAEFADDDCALAEEGIEDYVEGLVAEDAG